jgi:hypothetical protein
MAIVIGASSNVSFGGACVVSAQWAYTPNTQRLYCIGQWQADNNRIFHKPTETLNLTVYAPGPPHQIPVTETCTDANTITADINPVVCNGGSYSSFSGEWHVTGYSYSKDDGGMPGQESWSLTRWKGLTTPDPTIGQTSEPSYVMRGISEGQGTSNAGLSFVAGTTVDSESGNVSAGGFGRADILTNGQITAVGGGSSAAGETGQGSAQINYSQLYI